MRSDAGSRRDPGPLRRRIAALSPAPLTEGPAVRLGILWFLLALAAVTAGRWPTALLWGVAAMAAARELVRAGRSGPESSATMSAGVMSAAAMVLTVLPPLAAALGTGFAGAILALVVASLVAVVVGSRIDGVGISSVDAATLVVAVLLPTLPSVAVVLVTATDLWAGIFLVLAVSLYDAGYHIAAAESSSLLEGPVTGVVGVAAITFTMAIFQPPPFGTVSTAVTGILCALACPLGQWTTSALAPVGERPYRAVRRLDSYLVAAPVLLGVAWAIH